MAAASSASFWALVFRGLRTLLCFSTVASLIVSPSTIALTVSGSTTTTGSTFSETEFLSDSEIFTLEPPRVRRRRLGFSSSDATEVASSLLLTGKFSEAFSINPPSLEPSEPSPSPSLRRRRRRRRRFLGSDSSVVTSTTLSFCSSYWTSPSTSSINEISTELTVADASGTIRVAVLNLSIT